METVKLDHNACQMRWVQSSVFRFQSLLQIWFILLQNKQRKNKTKTKLLKLSKTNSYQDPGRSLGNTSKCYQSRKMK